MDIAFATCTAVANEMNEPGEKAVRTCARYLFEFMTAVRDASVVIYFHARVCERPQGDIRRIHVISTALCKLQVSGMRCRGFNYNLNIAP